MQRVGWDYETTIWMCVCVSGTSSAFIAFFIQPLQYILHEVNAVRTEQP